MFEFLSNTYYNLFFNYLFFVIILDYFPATTTLNFSSTFYLIDQVLDIFVFL